MYGPAPPNMPAAQELYLLDITGGANQVQTVFANPHNIYWNATLSPDGQRLSISETNRVNGVNIVVQPATGGQDTSIYGNQTQGTTEVCAATNNTLLVSISADHTTTHPTSSSSNGLYRMNASGTEPVKLFPLDNTHPSWVTAGCMYSWQTVSRDGSMYAFAAQYGQISKLYFGTLDSNSQPMAFAETSNNNYRQVH